MAEKKQVPLRLSEKLYADIAAWAEDDFRSVNRQIAKIVGLHPDTVRKYEEWGFRKTLDL